MGRPGFPKEKFLPVGACLGILPRLQAKVDTDTGHEEMHQDRAATSFQIAVFWEMEGHQRVERHLAYCKRFETEDTDNSVPADHLLFFLDLHLLSYDVSYHCFA